MDRFSAIFENKTQNQKVLIGVGVMFFTLAVIFLSFILDTSKQKPQAVNNVPGPTGISKETGSGSGNFPTPVSSQAPKSYLYSGKGYTITYPVSWKTQVIPGTRKEQVTFLPSTNPPDSYSPSLKIRAGDYNQADFAKIEADHALYFKKEQSQFKGIQAEKFTGVLPPPGFKGPVTKPTYTTAYLFVNNDKMFLIEYVYDGNSVNAEWENFMNEIVTTFRLLSP